MKPRARRMTSFFSSSAGRHVGALHPADEGEGEGAVGLHEEGLGEVGVPVDGDAEDVGGADLVVGLPRERGACGGRGLCGGRRAPGRRRRAGRGGTARRARDTRLMGERYTLRKHVRPSARPTGAVAARPRFSGWGSPRWCPSSLFVAMTMAVVMPTAAAPMRIHAVVPMPPARCGGHRGRGHVAAEQGLRLGPAGDGHRQAAGDLLARRGLEEHGVLARRDLAEGELAVHDGHGGQGLARGVEEDRVGGQLRARGGDAPDRVRSESLGPDGDAHQDEARDKDEAERLLHRLSHTFSARGGGSPSRLPIES